MMEPTDQADLTASKSFSKEEVEPRLHNEQTATSLNRNGSNTTQDQMGEMEKALSQHNQLSLNQEEGNKTSNVSLLQADDRTPTAQQVYDMVHSADNIHISSTDGKKRRLVKRSLKKKASTVVGSASATSTSSKPTDLANSNQSPDSAALTCLSQSNGESVDASNNCNAERTSSVDDTVNGQQKKKGNRRRNKKSSPSNSVEEINNVIEKKSSMDCKESEQACGSENPQPKGNILSKIAFFEERRKVELPAVDSASPSDNTIVPQGQLKSPNAIKSHFSETPKDSQKQLLIQSNVPEVSPADTMNKPEQLLPSSMDKVPVTLPQTNKSTCEVSQDTPLQPQLKKPSYADMAMKPAVKPILPPKKVSVEPSKDVKQKTSKTNTENKASRKGSSKESKLGRTRSDARKKSSNEFKTSSEGVSKKAAYFNAKFDARTKNMTGGRSSNSKRVSVKDKPFKNVQHEKIGKGSDKKHLPKRSSTKCDGKNIIAETVNIAKAANLSKNNPAKKKSINNNNSTNTTPVKIEHPAIKQAVKPEAELQKPNSEVKGDPQPTPQQSTVEKRGPSYADMAKKPAVIKPAPPATKKVDEPSKDLVKKGSQKKTTKTSKKVSYKEVRLVKNSSNTTKGSRVFSKNTLDKHLPANSVGAKAAFFDGKNKTNGQYKQQKISKKNGRPQNYPKIDAASSTKQQRKRGKQASTSDLPKKVKLSDGKFAIKSKETENFQRSRTNGKVTCVKIDSDNQLPSEQELFSSCSTREVIVKREVFQSTQQVDQQPKNIVQTNKVTDHQDASTEARTKVTDHQEASPEAPNKVTDHQDATTEAPNMVTDHQDATTEAPNKVTDHQDATTEAPNKVTDYQDATTEAPNKVTDHQDASAEAPNKVTDHKEASTEAPNKVTDHKEASTEAPNKVTDHQEASPEEPSKITDHQDAKTEATTEAPNKVTDHQDATTEAPNKVTDHQDATTEAPNKVTDDQDASTEAPNKVTDHKEASTEAPNKVTDHQDATTEAPNKVTDHQDATTEATTEAPNKVADHQDATTEAPNKVTDHQDASTEAPNKVTDHQEPSTDHQEPSTEAPNKVTDHQEPSTEAPNKVTDHQDATIKAPNKATDHQEPSTEAPNKVTDPQEASPEATSKGMVHEEVLVEMPNNDTKQGEIVVKVQVNDADSQKILMDGPNKDITIPRKTTSMVTITQQKRHTTFVRRSQSTPDMLDFFLMNTPQDKSPTVKELLIRLEKDAQKTFKRRSKEVSEESKDKMELLVSSSVAAMVASEDEIKRTLADAVKAKKRLSTDILLLKEQLSQEKRKTMKNMKENVIMAIRNKLHMKGKSKSALQMEEKQQKIRTLEKELLDKIAILKYMGVDHEHVQNEHKEVAKADKCTVRSTVNNNGLPKAGKMDSTQGKSKVHTGLGAPPRDNVIQNKCKGRRPMKSLSEPWVQSEPLVLAEPLPPLKVDEVNATPVHLKKRIVCEFSESLEESVDLTSEIMQGHWVQNSPDKDMNRMRKMNAEISEINCRYIKLRRNFEAVSNCLEETKVKNQRLKSKYETAYSELQERDAERAEKKKRSLGRRFRKIFGCASARSDAAHSSDLDDMYVQSSSQPDADDMCTQSTSQQ
uniref:Uncharacterized protein n=1 Tax=Clytia hemisphaerica TaxID=252671 RepID=A0A7M5V2Z6_9CNID